MNARIVVMWLTLLLGGLQLPAQSQDGPREYASLEGAGTLCIALAVFAEAPKASWLGQAMVAQVVVNRQRGLLDACDVVADTAQFPALAAWAYPRRPWSDDPHRWAAALDIARQVSAGELPLPPKCLAADSFRAAGAISTGHVVCAIDTFDFTAGASSPQAAVARGYWP